MNQETVEGYVDEIKAHVALWRNGELVDPPLQSELLTKTLTELGALAAKQPPMEQCGCFDGGSTWHSGHMVREYHLEPNPDCPVHFGPEVWAARLIATLHMRAVSGIPFGEPDERPYEYTLDAEERGGR